LFKPGKLSQDEFELMKRHTTIGYDIIKHIRQLSDAARVALNHHERWNGSGYPAGLKGEAVELDSRIVGLADSLDTILSDRPYRKGATLPEAIAEIDRCSGALYDPAVVEAFHQVVGENGADFFVNSASLVEVGAYHDLRWKPADNVAVGARA
jgi:HD-GYP domain-containing protein (c-di-GMP phosphodiesterase class II)